MKSAKFEPPRILMTIEFSLFNNNYWVFSFISSGPLNNDAITTRFCVKQTTTSTEYSRAWPKGNYCIAKKFNCPSGIVSHTPGSPPSSPDKKVSRCCFKVFRPSAFFFLYRNVICHSNSTNEMKYKDLFIDIFIDGIHEFYKVIAPIMDI